MSNTETITTTARRSRGASIERDTVQADETDRPETKDRALGDERKIRPTSSLEGLGLRYATYEGPEIKPRESYGDIVRVASVQCRPSAGANPVAVTPSTMKLDGTPS